MSGLMLAHRLRRLAKINPDIDATALTIGQILSSDDRKKLKGIKSHYIMYRVRAIRLKLMFTLEGLVHMIVSMYVVFMAMPPDELLSTLPCLKYNWAKQNFVNCTPLFLVLSSTINCLMNFNIAHAHDQQLDSPYLGLVYF